MRGETTTPENDLATGLDGAFGALAREPQAEQSVVVFRTPRRLDALLPDLERLLGEPIETR
jgi:hypothetical protein